MPFAIKLSKQFYDTLGNEVANELVTVLNTLDQAYRTEFRDLFTAHAGRLEDRMSQLEIRLEARMDAKLEALKSELLRWMFLFWVGTLGTVVALLKL